MTLLYQAATAFSVVVFLFYGTACLFSDGMKADFERFGLSRVRLLIGVLEVLGAVGLVAGQFINGLAIVSAGTAASKTRYPPGEGSVPTLRSRYPDME